MDLWQDLQDYRLQAHARSRQSPPFGDLKRLQIKWFRGARVLKHRYIMYRGLEQKEGGKGRVALPSRDASTVHCLPAYVLVFGGACTLTKPSPASGY